MPFYFRWVDKPDRSWVTGKKLIQGDHGWQQNIWKVLTKNYLKKIKYYLKIAMHFKDWDGSQKNFAIALDSLYNKMNDRIVNAEVRQSRLLENRNNNLPGKEAWLLITLTSFG